jgi:phage terminase small subunit
MTLPVRHNLTLSQQAFVAHYCEHLNASDAYRAAYNPGPEVSAAKVTAMAGEVKRSKGVAAAIQDVLDKTRNPTVFNQQLALQAWLDIARANPNELISLRVGCCRYCHGQGHAYQWRLREYLEAVDRVEKQAAALALAGKATTDLALPDPAGGFDFNATLAPVEDCPECHGEGVERVVPRDTTKLSPDALLLYGGVKSTRNGVEIIMADRVKALENACRIIGAFDDKMRVSGQLATMQAAIQLQTTDPNEAARVYQQMLAGMPAGE